MYFDVVKKIADLAREYNVRIYFKNKNLGLCTKSDPGIMDYDKYRDITDKKDLLDLYAMSFCDMVTDYNNVTEFYNACNDTINRYNGTNY